MKLNNNAVLKIPLSILFAYSVVFLIPSCASQRTAAVEVDTPAVKTAEGGISKSVEPSSETAIKETKTQTTQTIDMVGIGESCKQQTFVNYEKQAREHIQRGWEATQAQRFGVGFRDTAEYDKWSDTHKKLFSKVSAICAQLSDCIKQNPAEKDQKCASEAQRFEQWQAHAKRFVDKVKIVESSQPPMLCSLTPSVDEPTQCYALVADQIEKTCQTTACKDASSCFRGVYFLDDAINQAKLACGFVGQDLSQCRGYIEATARRKAEVEQCIEKYNKLQEEILPVL